MFTDVNVRSYKSDRMRTQIDIKFAHNMSNLKHAIEYYSGVIKKLKNVHQLKKNSTPLYLIFELNIFSE